MSEVSLVARRIPHGCVTFTGAKEMDPPGPVPAATSDAPALTLILAPPASET